jgi:hypothetical protein
MDHAVRAAKSNPRNPPRAPLAFRVGVVGHRPDRLKTDKLDELTATIRLILSTVKDEMQKLQRDCRDIYDGAGLGLKAVSPLAEGTDRIFAEQALHLCFELCSILPFPKAEFENDFVPPRALEADSLTRFRNLLDSATTRFELDGTRAEEAEAYGAGGRVVLNQSDLLIVVWDGLREHKPGGTEEIFDEARGRGMTVVWIDAHEPQKWRLLDVDTPLPNVPEGQRATPQSPSSSDDLRGCVREVIELPLPRTDAASNERQHAAIRGTHPRRALQDFYHERQRRWSVFVLWKMFVRAVGDSKPPKVRFRVDYFEESTAADWPTHRSTRIAQFVDCLRPFYAWPDKLAVLYGDFFRSTFLFAYLLAAIAVGLALLPVGLGLPHHHPAERVFIILELAAIVAILVLVALGVFGRWHERWIEYRFTAELVRHLCLVAPLGGRRAFPQIPAHWASYGQPGSTWMGWYVRSVERALGLPSAVVDKRYIEEHVGHLAEVVNEQAKFHENATGRYHAMETRLHTTGIILLGLTLLACLLHLVHSFWPDARWTAWMLPLFLTFLCGFCPALGAALAGMTNQGEFRRLTNRSEAMTEQLHRLHARIKALHQEILATDAESRQFSRRAVDLAGSAAGLLVNEVLDWRVVLLEQPLRPPG